MSAAPAVSAPAVSHPVASSHIRWSPAARFGFRFAFCYLLLYAFGCGNATLLELIPKIGDWLQDHVALIWLKPAEWLAQHVVHITGIGAHIHDTGSGDTAILWLATGLIALTALFAAVVWTLLDRRRLQYLTAAAWLRFLLRLTLVFAMLDYGFAKLIPMQMSLPSLAVLNEPFGSTSPMTLLWTLIGLNPVYEMICGFAEVLAGLLLFFRRTALAGALLTAFVMTNVLLFNLFFDVPVKIYAAHLVLFSLAVIAPDLRALVTFFWHHRPAAPTGVWVPPVERQRFRFATLVVEVAVVALFLCSNPPKLFKRWHGMQTALQHPSPLTGEWHLDSALLTTSGHATTRPILTGDGVPMDAFFLEPTGRCMIRSTDGVLWRSSAKIDAAKHTFDLSSYMFPGGAYTMAQPSPTQLVLTPTGKDAGKIATLEFTRVPLPTHYPLLDRGFHLVNEWGFER